MEIYEACCDGRRVERKRRCPRKQDLYRVRRRSRRGKKSDLIESFCRRARERSYLICGDAKNSI